MGILAWFITKTDDGECAREEGGSPDAPETPANCTTTAAETTDVGTCRTNCRGLLAAIAILASFIVLGSAHVAYEISAPSFHDATLLVALAGVLVCLAGVCAMTTVVCARRVDVSRRNALGGMAYAGIVLCVFEAATLFVAGEICWPLRSMRIALLLADVLGAGILMAYAAVSICPSDGLGPLLLPFHCV